MITSDGGARNLDAKIFVEDLLSFKILHRTELPPKSFIVPSYDGEAYRLISECDGKIVAAILTCYEDSGRVAALHQSLRVNMSKIYHWSI